MKKGEQVIMEAKQIHSFDIKAAGGGKGLLGDIDGDGRMEVVFVQKPPT